MACALGVQRTTKLFLVACFSALLRLVAQSPAMAQTAPPLPWMGRWTPSFTPASYDAYVAVHLALLRDSSQSTYHSKVIWWNDEDAGSVHGDLYGWNPNLADSCMVFPDTTTMLHPLPLAPSNFQMFCGGSTQLADGRFLVAGGTEAGEVGIKDSKFYNPMTNSCPQRPHK